MTEGGRDAAASVPPALVGREADLGVLRAFVTAARREGAALLLLGDVGVGKSALVDAAVAQASAHSMRLVRVTGAESEVQAPYSALDRILAPFHHRIARLPAEHHRSLSTAFGLVDGTPPGHGAVAAATVSLLRTVGSAQPCLLVVEDAQWLDPASARVLAYAARRLAGSRVGVLAASRPEPTAEGAFAAALPTHEVRPLPRPAAERLTTVRFPELSRAVRLRVLAEAEGNPLALLELPAGLTHSQRTGRAPLPPVLALSDRLGSVFTARVQALPAPTRHALLLAALHAPGSLDTLQVAMAGTDLLERLAPAERAHLVVVDEASRSLVFRHPLIRSTAVESASAVERRRAHRALAESLRSDPPRRAWHLADAALHPDEEVAALLEAGARISLQRGDASGAVRALTRAAELSEDRQERARRLVRAAYLDADVTGDLAGASALLSAADGGTADVVPSVQASMAAAALLVNAEADVDTAHRLLATALRRHADRRDPGDSGDPGDPGDEVWIDALHTLVMLSWFGGRAELWAPVRAALAELRPEVPALLDACERTLGDPVRSAAPGLGALDALTGTLAATADPVEITRTALACHYVDRTASCREALSRVVRSGRSGGAAALAINALVWSCVDDWLTGRWDEATALAAEGARMSEEYGYRRYGFILGGYVQALVAAARGEVDGPLSTADDLIRWAQPRGAGIAVQFAHHLRALVALGAGRCDEAYRHATAVSPAGELAPFTPHALWLALDVVEAAVQSGRPAEAAAHVRAMQEADVGRLSSRMALVTEGCAAMVAPPARAADVYERALAVPGASRWPFEQARIQLAYGDHLRRRRATDEARAAFGEALEVFERLQAGPWTTRAAQGLRATGRAAVQDPAAGGSTISPHQWAIARLAASGLTNRQIADRLHLSHRTVGASLYQLYPKLGVTSRAALHDALTALTPPDGRDGERATS